jgi:transcription termination factor Rho
MNDENQAEESSQHQPEQGQTPPSSPPPRYIKRRHVPPPLVSINPPQPQSTQQQAAPTPEVPVATQDEGEETLNPEGNDHQPVTTPSGQPPKMTNIADIQRMEIDQLNQFGKQIGLKHLGTLTKSQMVFEIVKMLSENPNDVLYGEGVLEILPDGFGFLRSPNYNYLPSAEDIYISPAQVRRFDLKKGDTISGTIRSPKEKEKYFALLKVDEINGEPPEKARDRVLFENLTPLYPSERIVMETTKDQLSNRVLDLASPIGKGQRGLIVAPH